MGKKIEDLLPELESLIQHHEKLVPSVSQRSIGWQLDHSLKVIKAVLKVTPESVPTEYKPKFNFTRIITFALGWFPRGAGKAPKVVTSDSVSEYELILQLKEVKEGLPKMNELQEGQFFKHPLFGDLNEKRTRRFLYIHTSHHLKIMRDILNS